LQKFSLKECTRRKNNKFLNRGRKRRRGAGGRGLEKRSDAGGRGLEKRSDAGGRGLERRNAVSPSQERIISFAN
jgi:hypothetical protein